MPALVFCYMLCCSWASCDGIQIAPGLPSGLIDLALVPVAVPGRCGVRRSGLASCRLLPLAPLPESATGGGRVAPLLGKLLVRDEFFHNANLLMVSVNIIAQIARAIIKDLKNHESL